MSVVCSSKIRGSLYSMLAGDCLGHPYEGHIHIGSQNTQESNNYREIIIDYVLDFPESWIRNVNFHKAKVGFYSGFADHTRPTMLYTSSVAMSRNVIESLLECNGFNAENMSRKLTETYFTERNIRHYRVTLETVFEKMKKINFKDVNKPAKEQFGGNGSFGAYGAARSSPIALFYAKNLIDMIETTKQQCFLTHTHPNAVMGAVLQVAAVYFALHCDKENLQMSNFLNKLKDIMKQQEKLIYKKARNNPYNEKFAVLSTLLENNCSINIVSRRLGAGNRAVNAVPAAIFSFLKCLEASDEMDLLNPIVRTIAYAIALGGETNTVASMAGAIAGAFYGDNFVPTSWLKTIEGSISFLKYSKFFCNKLGIECSRKLDYNNSSLASFRGCLLGALAGDCFGNIYNKRLNFYNEQDAETFRALVGRFMKDFSQAGEKGSLPYTVSAMTRNVAESLITCDGFNPTDMAYQFAESYFNNSSRRSYSCNEIQVFKKWKETNYTDINSPAREQYNGRGSYDNFGALRVAPVALFFAKDLNIALEIAKSQCRLTHSHPDAVMGAILETAAIHFALHAETDSLDQKAFFTRLCDVMKEQEPSVYANLNNPYKNKLESFASYFDGNRSSLFAICPLGNELTALNSVPAAIFAFVHCLKPEDGEMENPLLRTLAYAISLGGDNDSVASLAGAIAGAYYGDYYIPKSWLSSLEDAVDFLQCANSLQKKLLV